MSSTGAHTFPYLQRVDELRFHFVLIRNERLSCGRERLPQSLILLKNKKERFPDRSTTFAVDRESNKWWLGRYSIETVFACSGLKHQRQSDAVIWSNLSTKTESSTTTSCIHSVNDTAGTWVAMGCIVVCEDHERRSHTCTSDTSQLMVTSTQHNNRSTATCSRTVLLFCTEKSSLFYISSLSTFAK